MTLRPLLLVPSLLSAAPVAWAQDVAAPDFLAPVRSMGKPPVWKPFVGGYYGLDRSGDANRSGGAAFAGFYKDLMPSIVGIGASGEAYVGGYSGLSGVNGGVRALAELRGHFLKAGVDPAEFIEWTLENDKGYRGALYSSDGDTTIRFFLSIPTAAAYRSLLLSTHYPIVAAFPNRYKRFIRPSTVHTAIGSTLFYTVTSNGILLYQWLADFVNDAPGWVDTVQ